MRVIYSGFVVLGLLLLFSPQKMFSQNTAEDIIKHSNDLINQPSAEAVVKMIITTTSGKKRELKYKSYSIEKGKSNLIKYLFPKRVEGQSILMLNNADDIWVYFPRTNRVRKLATHAKRRKMEGSNFSYEDMGSGDSWVTDFEAKMLGEEKLRGKECYKIELMKKPKIESGYSRLIMWIDKSSYVPLQIDYYDEHDPKTKLKRLILGNIKEIDGIPTPMKMTMIDVQGDSQTEMEFESISYNVKLDKDMFTERGMKK